MASDQLWVYNLEAAENFDGAARALIEMKYYQVSRSKFLLARLPINTTPQEALERALIACGNPMRDGPSPTARSAANQYLTYHAPDSDKIYVMSDTLAAYRKLGGGLYKEEGWGTREQTGDGCIFCDSPANFMGKQLCDSCQFIVERLPNLMRRTVARDHVLQLVGQVGVHETFMMVQGAHNASRTRERLASENRAGVAPAENEGEGDRHSPV